MAEHQVPGEIRMLLAGVLDLGWTVGEWIPARFTPASSLGQTGELKGDHRGEEDSWRELSGSQEHCLLPLLCSCGA